MAEWKYHVGTDPITGTKTELIKESDEIGFKYVSPMEALISENRRLDNQPQHGRNTRLAARIPAHLYHIDWPKEFEKMTGHHPMRTAGKLRRDVREAWKGFIKRKLNSSEFRYLRVDGGRKL